MLDYWYKTDSARIENIPPDVECLDLGYNNITKIENIPANVKILRLGGNQITKIENIPSSVKELKLGINKISCIENIPPNIRWLDLGYNPVTKIKNIPSTLKWLCYHSINSPYFKIIRELSINEFVWMSNFNNNTKIMSNYLIPDLINIIKKYSVYDCF